MALGMVALCTLAVRAHAQRADDAARYPVRPARMVIGFTPGGQPDIAARMIVPRLSESLGQQIVLDKRRGAGGVVGTKIVTDAQPHGHTLLTSPSSIAISPAIYPIFPPWPNLATPACAGMAGPVFSRRRKHHTPLSTN